MFGKKFSEFAEWVREGDPKYKAEKDNRERKEKLSEELKQLDISIKEAEQYLSGMGYFGSDRGSRVQIDFYNNVTDIAQKEAERLEKLKARKAEIESELKEGE